MDFWSAWTEPFVEYQVFIEFIVIIALVFLIFSLLFRVIRRQLYKTVHTRIQRSNVTVFTDLLKYVFFFLFFIFMLSFYFGNLGDFGFVAGLLTVAVGWALQKPISGVVAWVILATRRPFHIGDRVIIRGIKGDITNITLTHVLLNEVGGTIDGEEESGRTIMVPTSVIFEEEVINFTERDDYILDEIVTSITYESDLLEAERLIIQVVLRSMQTIWETFPKRISKKPHIRLQFRPSGIDVCVRFYTIAVKRNKIATDIRREIWKVIRRTEGVEFAYPHTEIIYSEKKKSPRLEKLSSYE